MGGQALYGTRITHPGVWVRKHIPMPSAVVPVCRTWLKKIERSAGWFYARAWVLEIVRNPFRIRRLPRRLRMYFHGPAIVRNWASQWEWSWDRELAMLHHAHGVAKCLYFHGPAIVRDWASQWEWSWDRELAMLYRAHGVAVRVFGPQRALYVEYALAYSIVLIAVPVMAEIPSNPYQDRPINPFSVNDPTLTGNVLQVPGSKPPSPFASVKLGNDQPTLLAANQVDYDEAHKMVIAQGKVEVNQGDTILLADTLTYDQRNDIVFAQGDVSVLEPSGNVYFADVAELTDNMKQGVVGKMRARFTDNSLFAANEGERISENVTILHQAVYSPCSILCDDGTHKDPLWEIRADKATLDRGEQKIYYRDAYMDVSGVPVLYTPYFSQAMPGADNKSGLLTPTLRRDSNLGNVFELPVYWAIGKDKDMTLTPMYASIVAPVLIGEYRQRFNEGNLKLHWSITDTGNLDPLGTPINGNEIRGHIFGDGAFRFSDEWQWGFNVQRTTDDTYLRVYGFNNDPLLTSRLYGEGFNFTGDGARSYVVAQGLAFQGLQQQVRANASPVVLPNIDAFYQTQPMAWNSRFMVSGDAMSLTRSVGDTSRRLSVKGVWSLPYVTDSGHVFTFNSQLRADGYDISDFTQPDGTVFRGQEGRLLPQASLEWRYPLITRFASSSLVVEPIANAVASPNSGNLRKIPNEDSATPEFNDTNLFSDNRFPGFDRVETGPRATYGVRSQLQVLDDKSISAMLGQTVRANSDPLFPISSDARSHLSDYVGRVGFTYLPLDVNYRFRIDKSNYTLTHQELESALTFKRLILGVTYFQLRDDPVLGNKQGVTPSASVRLTEHWTINTSSYRDLELNHWAFTNLGLIYQDECVTLNVSGGRNYAVDRDLKASNNVKVQLILKNLN